MVLVKFRTVQSKLYKIDLPSNANISQAKQEMSKEMGGNDPSSMKMIYKAKVLSDEVPISSLKLGEKDFILVNTPKAKPSNPVEQVQKPPEAEPVPEASPKAEPLPLHDVQPIPLNENPQVPAPEAGNGQEKFDDGVNKLVEIGFDRELSVQALTLARGNVDIAAELIITGQIGGDHSGQNSEDEAEDAPVNAPNDIPDPPANPELPPELTNLSPDQAAETLLAALPQSEQDAIHRLQKLGNFPLLEVIQIYHACDKNEELAANILLSNLDWIL